MLSREGVIDRASPQGTGEVIPGEGGRSSSALGSCAEFPQYRLSPVRRVAGITAGVVLLALGAALAALTLRIALFDPAWGTPGASDILLSPRAVIAYGAFVAAVGLLFYGVFLVRWHQRWLITLCKDAVVFRDALRTWRLRRCDLELREGVRFLTRAPPARIRRRAGGRPHITIPGHVVDTALGDWLAHITRAEAAREVQTTTAVHVISSGWSPPAKLVHFRPVTYGLLALNTLVFFYMSAREEGAGDFLWMSNYLPLTFHGEIWRLWSSTFVHASFLHLAGNMLFLWYAGRYVEAMYGPGRYLLLYFAAGGCASLLSALMHPDTAAVGASGAVFGVLGAELAFAFWKYGTRRLPQGMRKQFGKVTSLVIRLLVFGLLPDAGHQLAGESSRVDVWAHVGGLVTGIVLGMLLRRPLAGRGRSEEGSFRPLAVLAAVALILTLPLWTDALGGAQARANARLAVNAIQGARANLLGVNYRDGRGGVWPNQRLAARWFQEGAQAGDRTAQFNLARQYELGRGVQKDLAMAAVWYRKAAEQGLAVAQIDLGVAYAKGLGVQQDPREAVRWFRSAALQDDKVAQTDLGNCYLLGFGVARNPSEAAYWLAKAAARGYAIAQRNYGRLLMNGDGVDQDVSAAATWLGKAADQGDPEAQSYLADLQIAGRGVPRDEAAAVIGYRRAAARNVVEAQYKLGVLMLSRGHGDTEAGLYWLGRAADQNDVRAQNALGAYYRDSREFEKAAYWFQRAAFQGSSTAEHNLSEMSARGEGLPRSRSASRMWLARAASHGSGAAGELLAQAESLPLGSSSPASRRQRAPVITAPTPESVYGELLRAFMGRDCTGESIQTLRDQIACVDTHTQPSPERSVFDTTAGQLLQEVESGKMEEGAARRAIYREFLQRSRAADGD